MSVGNIDFVGAGQNSDDNFVGFDPDGVPSPDLDFSQKDEGAPTNPDVIVDIREGSSWVRLPITQAELYINKDGPADITRTAKVTFPAEWGGEPMSTYINGFQARDPEEDVAGNLYDQCRIFFYDEAAENWNIVHYGYIGGVGPAAGNGLFKFWCYDPADLMKGIQVSQSFGEPTIAEMLEFVLNGTDEQGRPVGVNERSVFDDIGSYVTAVSQYSESKPDTIFGTEVGSVQQSPAGPYRIEIPDIIVDFFNDTDDDSQINQGLLGGQKTFQTNRHNMIDVMDWFVGEVGGKWHFEPTPDGPVLFFDNLAAGERDLPDGDIARRVFVENEIADEDLENPSGFPERSVYTGVDTLNNNALVDIKPFNTLILTGESSLPINRYSSAFAGQFENAGSAGVYTEEYPYVKLVYGPLLERAGGYEYSTAPVESDKKRLNEAKNQAIEEFRAHLAEESEGEITLKGEPDILPYDYLRTVPACNETFPNADADPVTYEVNAVRHVRKAGERYKTTVRSSIVFSEDDLDITAEYQTA